MKNKELRKLKRRDLLELLMQQEQENERLNLKIAELEKKVSDRNLSVEKAGSIAEAALVLNGIFEAADKAVAQYQENLKRSSEEQKEAYDRIIFEAEQKANEIIQTAEREKIGKIKEIDVYWCKLRGKLDAYCSNYADLEKILSQKPGDIR